MNENERSALRWLLYTAGQDYGSHDHVARGIAMTAYYKTRENGGSKEDAKAASEQAREWTKEFIGGGVIA